MWDDTEHDQQCGTNSRTQQVGSEAWCCQKSEKGRSLGTWLSPLSV